MRKIDKIIVHCSATPQDMDIGVAEIRQWHLDKGWSDIGYHYVIRRNGICEVGRPEWKIGAHVRGHNSSSVGICLVGGTDADNKEKAEFNYTKDQMDMLEQLIYELLEKYPQAGVCGHNDYTQAKTCPNFDVKAWWE